MLVYIFLSLSNVVSIFLSRIDFLNLYLYEHAYELRLFKLQYYKYHLIDVIIFGVKGLFIKLKSFDFGNGNLCLFLCTRII